MNADATFEHLYHFCHKLPHRPYVDFSPQFSYREEESGLIEAQVSLPSGIPAQLRSATSKRTWKTERAARKDAAFQAYSALNEAGLLNDNLLPLCHDWADDYRPNKHESQQPITEPQLSIWSELGPDLMECVWFETVMRILPPDNLDAEGEEGVTLRFVTPCRLPSIPPLALYWTPECEFTIALGRAVPIPHPKDHEIKLLQDATWLLYSSVRTRNIVRHCDDLVALIAPRMQHDDLVEWLQRSSPSYKASSVVGSCQVSLVRGPHPSNPPYVFHRWSTSDEANTIQCERLPRRRNFLLPAAPQNRISASTPSQRAEGVRLETYLAEECTFDSLPLPLARVGLFMPVIIQHIEDLAIAESLMANVLEGLSFSNREHVLTAICAPAAQRQSDYQRFEFLGDSVLKFVVSCHLFDSHPEWHEGYLTRKRSHMVSNDTLAQAAIRTGLVPYIMTEPIPFRTWQIPTSSSSGRQGDGREVSVKTLADVVEALIGASWIDSGITASRQCMHVFLPTIPSTVPSFILENPPIERMQFGNVKDVELLIEYKFNNPILLLEAFTHPSCGGHSQTDSYQRLEYLGDAVLDILLAQHMAAYIDRLSQGRMTQLKAALVNAHLLGFLCLETRRSQALRAVSTDNAGQSTETTRTCETQLMDFMRTASTELTIAQRATQERYNRHQARICHGLESGKRYPWLELLHLRPDKFYSDVIESIIGAIFVDARGSLVPCMAFIGRIGLKAYMDRLIDEDIDVLHPRDRVQRWAGARTVSYDVQPDQLNKRLKCSLFIADDKVAEVEGCSDREEAVVSVASRFEDMTASEGMVVEDA